MITEKEQMKSEARYDHYSGCQVDALKQIAESIKRYRGYQVDIALHEDGKQLMSDGEYRHKQNYVHEKMGLLHRWGLIVYQIENYEKSDREESLRRVKRYYDQVLGKEDEDGNKRHKKSSSI